MVVEPARHLRRVLTAVPPKASRKRPGTIKIATFNINNVNRRLANLLAWLAAAEPDVVCLQELKSTDADFPVSVIRDADRAFVLAAQISAMRDHYLEVRCGCGARRVIALGRMADHPKTRHLTLATVAARVECKECFTGRTKYT